MNIKFKNFFFPAVDGEEELEEKVITSSIIFEI